MSEKRKEPKRKDVERVADLLGDLVNDECVVILLRRDGETGIHSQPLHTLRTAKKILARMEALKLPKP